MHHANKHATNIEQSVDITMETIAAPQVDVYDSDDDEAPVLVALDAAGSKSQSQSEKPQEPLPPCPVTILSGFLGAGKTTLIQYILKSPDHGKRIAVIENEFGEGLAVEGLIARDGINDSTLTDLIELPNGCLCCTVKDSLVAALETLLEKRSDLDYILIECSGMANPGPIASLFWLDDALDSRLRLDGIVTLVDAANIERQLQETEEAAQQIAYADRILLNKVDLVKTTDPLLATIRSIHPTVAIRPTTYAAVPDLTWILEARCFDADRAKEVEDTLNVTEEHSHDHSHEHEHDHDHDHEECAQCKPAQHRHTSAVSTVALISDGPVDWRKINVWLASILWPNQDEQEKVLRERLDHSSVAAAFEKQSRNDTTQQIFRIKGVVGVTNAEIDDTSSDDDFVDSSGVDTRRFIVQAVHDTWEIHPATHDLRWTKKEVRSSKLVVIGRYLQEESLRTGFNACLANN
jgi:G3E family GTPase